VHLEVAAVLCPADDAGRHLCADRLHHREVTQEVLTVGALGHHRRPLGAGFSDRRFDRR
jgi:hypothetical protein